MPILISFAGLATDSVQWSLSKRELRRTDDSAALAGVNTIARQDEADAPLIYAAISAKCSDVGQKLRPAFPNLRHLTESLPYVNLEIGMNGRFGAVQLAWKQRESAANLGFPNCIITPITDTFSTGHHVISALSASSSVSVKSILFTSP